MWRKPYLSLQTMSFLGINILENKSYFPLNILDNIGASLQLKITDWQYRIPSDCEGD